MTRVELLCKLTVVSCDSKLFVVIIEFGREMFLKEFHDLLLSTYNCCVKCIVSIPAAQILWIWWAIERGKVQIHHSLLFRRNCSALEYDGLIVLVKCNF